MTNIKNKIGEFEYDDSNIIIIKDGLFGFEEIQKYLLVKLESSPLSEMLSWIVAEDQLDIVFPLFPISMLVENYPEVKDHEPFGIVKLDKQPQNITVNLKAPVYINFNNKTGYQKIIDNDNYPINYNLLVED